MIEGATHVVKKVATAASKGAQQVMAVCREMATNAFREAQRKQSHHRCSHLVQLGDGLVQRASGLELVIGPQGFLRF